MSLTRSQLLMGNNTQGPLLPGQVQGVKEGPGVNIAPNGTISFDPTGLTSVVLTNNDDAFNGYIWPAPFTIENGTFLSINALGELSWNPPSIGSVVNQSPIPPTPAKIGKLWFDEGTKTLKVYENVDSLGQWTPVSQGNSVNPDNVSATPTFSSGVGTQETPYTLPVVQVVQGGSALSSSLITITGLAPFQFVPMIDLLASTNGYRFSPSSFFADSNGNLNFFIRFDDVPASAAAQAYGALFKIGFDSCYISASVTIASSLVLDDPGTISGLAQVGEILTYTPGSATGGIPPISYEWVWKKQGDGAVVQTDGQTLVVPSSLANDRVYVELIATDANYSSAIANTAGYPLAPALMGKGDFPLTTILFPTTTPGEISTLWIDSATTLEASGCIEFKVGAGSYSQGPTPVLNGQTITTRWVVSSGCAGAVTGTTIQGCIYDSTYQECASLTLDRIPSPFSFVPVSSIVPGNVGTSQIIVPMGINATAYVTYSGTSTASSIQASINGGAFVTVPLLGTNTLAINPGETLQVRATTGLSPSSSYAANINIGQDTSVQSGVFTLNTSSASNFTTPIPFPTTTIDVPAAVSWLAGDGSTTLTSTSCIEFSVNAGAFSQGPTPITTGDTITTQWNSGGSCGGSPHGDAISGTVTDVPAGGTKTSFASLTIDRVPASFSFSDLSNQPVNTLVTSNILNIVGFNAPAYITYTAPPSGSSLTSVEASVAGGPWTAIPSSGTTLPIDPVVSGPGNTLQIRGITGALTGTSYGVTVVIGSGSSIQQDTWTATTSAVSPSIVTPSITTPVNGAVNLTPFSSNPPGITVTSSAYSPLNGASATHQSTDWEIRSGSTGGPVVFSGNSLTQLTAFFLDASLVAPSLSYFVRARYYSGDLVPVVSNWSSWSQFTTSTSFAPVWVERVNAAFAGAPTAATWVGGTVNRFTLLAYNGTPVSTTAATLSFYSSDGITWLSGGSVTSNAVMRAICPGGGSYTDYVIAVGTGGAVRQSVNGGINWTTPGSLNTSKDMWAVACNPSGRFVAGGADGTLRTTTNPSTTWTTVSSGVSGLIRSITWDSLNSRFIAVSTGGSSSSNRLLTSPDGLTWTVSTSVTSIGFYSDYITVVPGPTQRYVINQRSESLYTYYSINYAVSTDLVTWTVEALPPVIAYPGDTELRVASAAIVGGGLFMIGRNRMWVSSVASYPFSFTETSFSGGLDEGLPPALAYSPLSNRFVLSEEAGGDINSTS